jgi:periplasmic copper chaperone A
MRRRRWVVVLIAATGAVLLTAGAAWAHVAVQPGSAAKGSFALFSFSVPNERDDANTVKLEVTFPTKYPIPSVSVQPKTGWTITVEKTKLDKPVKTDDGDVTEAVSKITWTATAGGLQPGEFDLFTVSAGPLPTKTSQLQFPTLQTYSNGEIVRWIQETAKGAPEPDFPVPVLKLTKAAGNH